MSIGGFKGDDYEGPPPTEEERAEWEARRVAREREREEEERRWEALAPREGRLADHLGPESPLASALAAHLGEREAKRMTARLRHLASLEGDVDRIAGENVARDVASLLRALSRAEGRAYEEGRREGREECPCSARDW